MNKTSDIYRALSYIRENKFTRNDIVYARENQKEIDVDETLLKIRPVTIWSLEERNCIMETPEGYQLTPYGSYLLREFEKKRREYGKGNVKLILAKVGDKITYKVKVVPNIKIKHQKYPIPSYQFSTLKKILSKKSEAIVSIREKEDYLLVKTKINYYRTTEERNRLNKIAEILKLQLKSDNEIYKRNYDFNIGDKTILTLVSRKRGKSLKSIEPLEIKINKGFIELSEKFINSLIEEFYKRR